MIPDAVRLFLDEPRFAVLATIGADGVPQQTVMWYQLRGNTIMMNTAGGRVKPSNLRRDPRVSICVADRYRYVTITGRAELIEDQEVAQADIATLAHRYHDPETAEQQLAIYRRETRITLLISIDRVTTFGF